VSGVASKEKTVLAFDIGGTYLRYSVIQQGKILEQKKEGSPSVARYADKTSEEMVDMLCDKVTSAVNDVKKQHEIDLIAIGMPGVVDSEGRVASAPPLWGDKVKDVSLKDILKKSLSENVYVFNDLCGTAIYYSFLPEYAKGVDSLMVITLSTGVGCKTVLLDDKRLVSESYGEIGHVQVDSSDEAMPCDCGGKGHLASYLSGRGLGRLIRKRLKEKEIRSYDHWVTLDDPALIEEYAKALKNKDSFAEEILDFVCKKFVEVIQTVSGSVGIERYVLVGGVTFILKEYLIEAINQRLLKCPVFAWPNEKMSELVKLGVASDDAGMIGAAQYALLKDKNNE